MKGYKKLTNHALSRKRSIILLVLIIFFDTSPKKTKTSRCKSVVLCKKKLREQKFPVLHDFQRCIEGVRSARHCHFKAMPHFCKPWPQRSFTAHGSLRLGFGGSEEGWKMGGGTKLGQRGGENKTNPYNLEFRKHIGHLEAAFVYTKKTTPPFCWRDLCSDFRDDHQFVTITSPRTPKVRVTGMFESAAGMSLFIQGRLFPRKKP